MQGLKLTAAVNVNKDRHCIINCKLVSNSTSSIE